MRIFYERRQNRRLYVIRTRYTFKRWLTEFQFYKPWKLTADEEDTIKTQVKDAEAKIETESAQWEADNPPLVEASEGVENAKSVEREEKTEVEVVGENTNEEDRPVQEIASATNGHDPHTTDERKKTAVSEAANHQGTEGEEMVEGEEDTVIY